jgi:hypothetical protein
MVRQVPFEQTDAAGKVAHQPGPAGHQKHCPDSPAGHPLDAIGQFILDVAGADHGTFPHRTWPILDALEKSPLALPQLLEDSRFHSKTPNALKHDDVMIYTFFKKHYGFSSSFTRFRRQGVYFTLGSG